MNYLIATLLFLFPTSIIRWVVNLSKRYHIARGVKVGFSLILVDKLCLEEGVRIGSVNFIKVIGLNIRGGGEINNLNFIRGNFYVHISEKGRIGGQNKISTATRFRFHDVHLVLGKGCNVNNGHFLDMTDSVFIGDKTTLAGNSTQIWTHSFFKSPNGPHRLDSPIIIGDNCYIGARCSIMPGIVITNNVIVGAQTCVHKNLDKAGMYVSQPIRFIEYDIEERLKSLGPVVRNTYIHRDISNEILTKERLFTNGDY